LNLGGGKTDLCDEADLCEETCLVDGVVGVVVVET